MARSVSRSLYRCLLRLHPPSFQAQFAHEMLWIFDDQQDLPRLAELLVKPGDVDKHGRDLASLPNQLVRAYGDPAVAYLERAVLESPYAFVRTQSAEELALRGRPVAFRFFLDAVENNRFYKQELVGWLRAHFADQIQGSEDDAVVAFLRSRLEP